MASCGWCGLCQKVTVCPSYRYDKRNSTSYGEGDDVSQSSSRRCSQAFYSAVSVGTYPRPAKDSREVNWTSNGLDTPVSRDASEVSYVTANDQSADLREWISAPSPLHAFSHNMGSSVPIHLAEMPFRTTSWSHRNACHFSVRSGPDYGRTGTKEPSLPSLYEPIGIDLIKGDGILSDVAQHMNFPTLPPWFSEKCRAPALLVVNAQLPGEGPSFNPFAAPKPDPGYSVIIYFMITREMASWSSRPNDPDVPGSVRLWLQLLDKGVSDRSLPFKVIGRVQNLSHLHNLPAMGIIQKYNGKPALITGSATIMEEIDYDVRKWSLVARTTLYQVKDRFKDVVLDVGYLVVMVGLASIRGLRGRGIGE